MRSNNFPLCDLQVFTGLLKLVNKLCKSATNNTKQNKMRCKIHPIYHNDRSNVPFKRHVTLGVKHSILNEISCNRRQCKDHPRLPANCHKVAGDARQDLSEIQMILKALWDIVVHLELSS